MTLCSGRDQSPDHQRGHCIEEAVAVVGVENESVSLSGLVCEDHMYRALAWLTGLRAGVPTLERLGSLLPKTTVIDLRPPRPGFG